MIGLRIFIMVYLVLVTGNMSILTRFVMVAILHLACCCCNADNMSCVVLMLSLHLLPCQIAKVVDDIIVEQGMSIILFPFYGIVGIRLLDV